MIGRKTFVNFRQYKIDIETPLFLHPVNEMMTLNLRNCFVRLEKK